jgi:hypothetical protein
MSIGKYTIWIDSAIGWQFGLMLSSYRFNTRRGTKYTGLEIGLPIITINIELVKFKDESRNRK